MGDMNAHLGKLSGGSVPGELLRTRRQASYQGYRLTPQRFLSEVAAPNHCGSTVDRFARQNGMLVLNGRAERDALGAVTMVWKGVEKSVLDLVLVPAVVSADLCVVKPRDGSMVHRAVVAWVHVAGEGLGAARPSDPAVVGTRPPVLRLMPP